MQSRKDSFKEVLTDTFIGFIGAWIINYGILHLDLSKEQLATLTVFACTVFSLVRKYCVRRKFNK